MHINLATPIEDGIGYGLCGTNLAIELSRRVDVNITCFTEQAVVQRPVEQQWLAPRIRATALGCDPSLPTLYVQDVGARPPGDPVVMYTCVDTERASAMRKACYGQMDVVVGMAEWNRQAFEDAGCEVTDVIPQGIDETLFFPCPAPRRVFEDRYVFFSGGKFEYRKGQDVVLAAWKIFHARHPDTMLMAAWTNAWPQTMQTMARSPHIELPVLNSSDDLPALLPANDINPDSVIWLPGLPNWAMAPAYRQCDCGLFPTRGEPATNLVMMELMACGKPVIASCCAGQTDVMEPGENCIALTSFEREHAGFGEEDLGSWWSPDVEELVESMEWCYSNRNAAADLGAQAGRHLHQHFTWGRSAERFVRLFARLGVAV